MTRGIATRRHRDGHPREEAAKLMGMKDEGMKTLLRRIKEILRECMERRAEA